MACRSPTLGGEGSFLSKGAEWTAYQNRVNVMGTVKKKDIFGCGER